MVHSYNGVIYNTEYNTENEWTTTICNNKSKSHKHTEE